MRKTQDLLDTARDTLASHPILWPPALTVILLQDAMFPMAAQGGSPAQALAGFCALLGAVLVGAGWLAMIGRALRGGGPTFRDFADGVNARWGSILLGTLCFWAVIAGLAGLAYAQGTRTYGLEALTTWFTALVKLGPEAQQAALDPARIPAAVVGWVYLATAWLVAATALHGLLLFWQPLVVLQGLGWLKAWAGSIGLVFRRFGQVVAVGLLFGVSMVGARFLIATMHPLLAMVGVACHIVTVTYFTVVFAAVVEDEWPAHAPTTDTHA
ncbi:MAG: hypothetical protein VKS61_17575 [Candidatus Sericytochromatia bacterium]|nr:hypothetical protein [Candidatus Sericytochromatia bacterium]